MQFLIMVRTMTYYSSLFASHIPMPVDENNPNLERGEFRIIQQLVKYLPGGKKIKKEVCLVIYGTSVDNNDKSFELCKRC